MHPPNTPIADMVEAMLAKGVAAELIILAIRTIEMSAGVSRDSHADKLETRRIADRLRKQKQRAKSALNETTPEANDAGIVTECHADSHVTAADKRCNLSTKLSVFSSLQEEEIKESKKVTTPKSSGTRLPLDAKLSEADRKFAIENGVVEPEARWVEFVDYWIAVPGSRGLKLNWSATWRNRIRAVSTKNGNGKPPTLKERYSNALQQLGGNQLFPDAPVLLPKLGSG